MSNVLASERSDLDSSATFVDGRQVRIGSIYVYRDPLTDRPMYVGSTQDGNTMRRHKEHLKEKRSIGPWLRSFLTSPEPHDISKVQYLSLDHLFASENYFIEVLRTFKRNGGLNVARAGQMCSTPEGCSKGGVRTAELHYDMLVENGRTNIKSLHMRIFSTKTADGRSIHAIKMGSATKESTGGKKNSIVQGQILRDRIKANPEYHLEISLLGLTVLHADKNETGKSKHAIKMGSIGGLKGGRRVNILHPGHSRRNALKACHKRWHVARHLVNPNCYLCATPINQADNIEGGNQDAKCVGQLVGLN